MGKLLIGGKMEKRGKVFKPRVAAKKQPAHGYGRMGMKSRLFRQAASVRVLVIPQTPCYRLQRRFYGLSVAICCVNTRARVRLMVHLKPSPPPAPEPLTPSYRLHGKTSFRSAERAGNFYQQKAACTLKV
jgi:hypothetical protein